MSVSARNRHLITTLGLAAGLSLAVAPALGAGWTTERADISVFDQNRQSASASAGIGITPKGSIQAIGLRSLDSGAKVPVRYEHGIRGSWQEVTGELPIAGFATAASPEGAGRVLFSGASGQSSRSDQITGVSVGAASDDPEVVDSSVGVTLSEAIAVNDRSQVLRAWSGFNGLYVQTRLIEENGWAAPFRLDNQAIGYGPTLDLNEYGDAIVSGADRPARLGRLEDGKWRKHKAPAQVRDTFGTTDWRPEVAVTPEGTALLAWSDKRTGISWAAHSRKGGKKWTVRQISKRGERMRPVGLESDASGAALAVFARVNGKGLVRASYLEGRGFRRSGFVGGKALRHLGKGSVAMDVAPSGEAVVAWAEPAGSGAARVRAISRQQRGGWSSPELIARGVATGTAGQVPLGVKVGESGDAAMIINGHGLAWRARSGARDEIIFRQTRRNLPARFTARLDRGPAAATVFEVRPAKAADTDRPLVTWKTTVRKGTSVVTVPPRVAKKLAKGRTYVVKATTYGRQVGRSTRATLVVR